VGSGVWDIRLSEGIIGFVIEARYHDSVNVLQEMFAEGALAPEVRAPFDRAEWYRLLAETGLVPLIAIAEDADARAALALTEAGGRITPLRNWYSFTWRQLAPAGERGDALIEEIARQLRGRGHRVTLAPVPEEDGSASRLASAFARAGWRVEVTACDANHVLHVGGRSFAEYWASRPGRLRTTHKRRAGKVEVTILESFEDEAWERYEAVYAASWKPTEGEPAMLRAFAAEEGRAGRLRLGLATHDGETVAAQFWTVENSVAYIHKLAHLESHRNLSPGTTLSAALFERVIDHDRVDLVDFGTGDEPYKRDWMEATRPRYQIDCLDMAAPRAWIDLARLALRRTLEANVPALARLPREG
jgi:hypothetical protein